MSHHAATYQELADAAPRQDERGHRAATNQAVLVSAIGLGLTGSLELAIAVLTGSVALLGDALHNLADVSTSAVVFLGFFVSKRRPSAGYPYGYERAEDLAGLGVALGIWASALFAGYESYLKLIAETETTHLSVSMAAAVIWMVGNFAVSRYKAHVARQIQSTTMEAEATHSSLDTISSLGALAGLLGVGLGYRWADPVAGFAVMLFIAHVGLEVTREIVHHLTDGVKPEHLEGASRAAQAMPGVEHVVVRGRWMGRSLTLEIEGDVSADTTIEQAQSIGSSVVQAVYDAVEKARRVQWIPRERHRLS
jgi:cation diffusion facilitator family transporter